VIAYKFLLPDGTAPFTGFRWELPAGEPGRWLDGRPDPCRSGVHACRTIDLPFWIGPVLYEIELDGEIVECRSKVVASRGRLLRPIEAWGSDLHHAYVQMCADRARERAYSVTPALEGWYAMAEASVGQGAAPMGFVTARIAEEASGPDGHRAERVHQASWLAKRLGLEPG
jgi:hypothetical protein